MSNAVLSPEHIDRVHPDARTHPHYPTLGDSLETASWACPWAEFAPSELQIS